jgi:hypothetical protein
LSKSKNRQLQSDEEFIGESERSQLIHE